MGEDCTYRLTSSFTSSRITFSSTLPACETEIVQWLVQTDESSTVIRVEQQNKGIKVQFAALHLSLYSRIHSLCVESSTSLCSHRVKTL